jgi:hypothetical protein
MTPAQTRSWQSRATKRTRNGREDNHLPAFIISHLPAASRYPTLALIASVNNLTTLTAADQATLPWLFLARRRVSLLPHKRALYSACL